MSAALLAAGPTPVRTVVIRPAPQREPPFDDELPGARAPHRFERRLPFDVTPIASPVWMPPPPRPRYLPDPGPWGRRLLVGMIETAGGHRPLHQLAALLSPSVWRGLGGDFEDAARQGSRHWLHRAKVRSVRAAEPAHGVAEVSATVDTGRRVRAVALRLEEQHGSWRCTRLQLG
jgi:hypothetical protein